MVQTKRQSKQRPNPVGILRAAGVLLVLGVGCVGMYAFQAEASTERPTNGAKETARKATAKRKASASTGVQKVVSDATDAYIAGNLELRLGERKLVLSRTALGAIRDEQAVAKEVTRHTALGTRELSYIDEPKVPIRVDREAVQEALIGVKHELDIAPVNARLDLEERKVHPAESGFAMDLFGSISAVEVALRSGVKSVELEGVEVPATVGIAELGVEDISTVLGSFSTKFSVVEKTRNDNLKLLASKIDGYVLRPNETFSFNDTTGMRTLEDGFKMAHVILAGEMVDGMAGGSCQISTTLHGAAFFGGLDILKSTPHSRPSTYVTLGLDATVVAGQVDLQLRNPYDFPVVIHYRVARGVAYVELLGKERPFDKVEFERNIDERIDFETVTREDSEMGMGNMVVDQVGYPGYKVSRVRRIYKDGKVVKTNTWKLRYHPVIEYARLGVNPDPNLPPPKQKKAHGPKPESGKFTMVR